jgi:hypothetical protein
MADLKRLTEMQKRFCVRAFACFLTPQQVADALKEEFGIKVGRGHIVFYDAGRNRKLRREFVELFERTRREFCEARDRHAIYLVAYRLGRLQRMSERAEQQENYMLAAKLLKQAAKDLGGWFTCRQDLSIVDPVKTLARLLDVPEEAILAGVEAEKARG